MSPTGSDSGEGSWESPLRTLNKAVTLARPGDAIRVLPGVYSEQLVLDSHGTGVAAITLRGEGTPRPTLTPGNTTRSAVIIVRGRWNLENLHVDVGGARMFAVRFEQGASLSRLSGSELHGGTSGAGVVIEGPSLITLQRNTIHHFIKPGGDSHGVAVVGPSRDIVIRGNDIHHNSGDSIQCQASAGSVEALLIEDNWLHDEGENGVDIKQCHHVTVRDNRLSGFPNTSVREPGTSAGEAVVIHAASRGITLQGNTISQAGRGVSVLGGSTPVEDLRVEGNIIQEIRNIPSGNGHGIRIASARNAWVLDNTLAATASYALMLAADGLVASGLTVRNNRLLGGSQPLLVRLGDEPSRPGLVMGGNHYAPGGVLKADGVQEKLSGEYSQYQEEFSGEQLLLSSPEKLEVWRQVLGVDQGSQLLP